MAPPAAPSNTPLMAVVAGGMVTEPAKATIPKLLKLERPSSPVTVPPAKLSPVATSFWGVLLAEPTKIPLPALVSAANATWPPALMAMCPPWVELSASAEKTAPPGAGSPEATIFVMPPPTPGVNKKIPSPLLVDARKAA